MNLKKLAAIPDNSDALIQIYDKPYISCQGINLTKSADIYFNGILRSETDLRQGVLPSPYQQLLKWIQAHKLILVHSKEHKDYSIGLRFVYDKPFQHATIYDIYHLELASKIIKTIKF